MNLYLSYHKNWS